MKYIRITKLAEVIDHPAQYIYKDIHRGNLIASGSPMRASFKDACGYAKMRRNIDLAEVMGVSEDGSQKDSKKTEQDKQKNILELWEHPAIGETLWQETNKCPIFQELTKTEVALLKERDKHLSDKHQVPKHLCDKIEEIAKKIASVGEYYAKTAKGYLDKNDGSWHDRDTAFLKKLLEMARQKLLGENGHLRHQ